MAFTSAITPSEVEPIRSRQVLVKLTTDRKLYEFASKRLQLDITGTINTGERFDLFYGDISETFIGADPADDSGIQLSTNSGSLPLDEYADLIAEELSANFTINKYFTIDRESSGGNEYVYIDPKDNLTLEFSQVNDMVNVTITTVSITNNDYEPNLKVVLIVETYDDYTDTWSEPKTHIKEPNPSLATFNIVKDFNLQHDFPGAFTINSSTFNIQACSLNIVKYRLKYAEHYGDPATTRKLITNENEFYAIYGGRSYLLRNINWWNTHKSNGEFLSLQPTTKYISYEQPEWLYWIWKYDSIFDGKINSKVYYADGTSGAVVQTDSFTCEYRKIYKITSTLSQLGYTNDPSNPIVKYEVWLTAFPEVVDLVSDKMTYIIDPKRMDYERFYAFGNSRGGVDIVRGTGKLMDTPKYTYKTATVYQGTSDGNEGNVDRSDMYQFDKKEQAYYKGSLGHHSKEYIIHLKELLISDNVRFIDTEINSFVHILVEVNSVNLFKDDDDLYKLEWQYRMAFDDYVHDKI